MATVAMGLLPKGGRFSICHRGIFLINWPFDIEEPACWLGFEGLLHL